MMQGMMTVPQTEGTGRGRPTTPASRLRLELWGGKFVRTVGLPGGHKPDPLPLQESGLHGEPGLGLTH